MDSAMQANQFELTGKGTLLLGLRRIIAPSDLVLWLWLIVRHRLRNRGDPVCLARSERRSCSEKLISQKQNL
eukprot:2905063-Rhodomonas_salina.1